MCALYQRHTKTLILITNGGVQAAGWDKDKDVFISVAQNTKRWKIMMHDPQVLAAIRSYSCTPVVYTRSHFCTPETVPQNKPEKITCYTFLEILSWDRAFCRPEAPSCKAADTFFLICNKAGTPQSDPAIFRLPRATRYMWPGLWPWLPGRPQHFLGALWSCHARIGLDSPSTAEHLWVPAPACPMAGTVREPQQVNWTWSAQELQICCIRSTESEARRCQVSRMSHFTWRSSGVRPQATVSSTWKRQGRLSPIHQFGSASGETLWNGGQLLGNHHYLLYGGGIGSATILLYLEDLWNPNQHAILCLKKFSIQRNIIDKLLQRRRKWPIR